MNPKELARVADAAFRTARERAGLWIACRPGCDSCCRKPFAITESDAERLSVGLSRLSDALRDEIVERANLYVDRVVADFPGDSEGRLDFNLEWREWFFQKHAGLACPALDEDSGACLVYSHRPVACRLYGPLIEIGGQTSDPCGLCYAGASPDRIEATRVTVPLPDGPPDPPRETLIAFALRDFAR